MLELIEKALTSPTGSFGFVASLIIGAFWLIHYVTKKVTIINSDHNVIVKQSDKMNNNIDDIRRDLSYLKGSIAVLKSKDGQDLIQSNSPISLTDKGVEVANELNANVIIENNWDKIFAVLETNICNKNAYDIQTYCIETAAVQPELFFDTISLNHIKNIAFREGKPFQYYSNVFAVLIRDKYLTFKNIDISEIDANDPARK